MRAILDYFHLHDFAVQIRDATRNLRPRLVLRTILGKDKRLIRPYLESAEPKRLHIGADKNVLPGWLNTDFEPSSDRSIFLDARRPFPLPSESFDYVFSEHMIEHIPFEAQCSMMRECFRVLKVGGRIRIGTPNLAFLIDLYRTNRTVLQEAYVTQALSSLRLSDASAGDVFVINNYVRAWGHQFIHDIRSLSCLMSLAGFTDIKPCAIGESDDPPFRGLENEGRMMPGFLALETVTVEATKAASAQGRRDSLSGIMTA